MTCITREATAAAARAAPQLLGDRQPDTWADTRLGLDVQLWSGLC
jgi:hypothetical protein